MAAQPDELVEAKDQYNQELDRKKILEGKANNFATISGTVATLLFGLGQFLIGKLIDLHVVSLYYLVTGLLVVGGSLAVVAIFFSVKGFQVEPYGYIVGGTVVQLPTFAALDYNANNLTAAYRTARDNNRSNNNKRAKNIQYAQYFFTGSMIIPPLILGLMLFFNLPNIGH